MVRSLSGKMMLQALNKFFEMNFVSFLATASVFNVFGATNAIIGYAVYLFVLA